MGHLHGVTVSRRSVTIRRLSRSLLSADWAALAIDVSRNLGASLVSCPGIGR